jgi:hypothetical protein
VLGFVLLVLIAIAAVPVSFVLALLDILARARKAKTIALIYFLQLVLSILAAWAIVNYLGNEANFAPSLALKGPGVLIEIAEGVAQFLLLIGLIPILTRFIKVTKSVN